MPTKRRVESTSESGPGDGEASELVGQTVDERYRVTSLIAEGGMGRVYRADHVQLSRPVAVKVLHPGYSLIPEVVRRFEREAVAVARLDHPNCVSVQDFGRLPDGALYLVMPFLEGTLLTDAIEAGAFPAARALHVARHVLAGLAHAHNAGIVHRDIKSDNVILVPHEGDPDFAKILDFGIAKIVGADEVGQGEAQLTVAGERFGTPAYMSPEQAVGGALDRRTDLYSVTVLLFEMLAGRRPFVTDDAIALMSMHGGKPAPALADCAPDAAFDDALEALVARGLAKDPGQRWPDAQAYLAAIDALSEPGAGAVAHGGAEAPKPDAQDEPPQRAWWRRLATARATWAATGVGAVAVAGALALSAMTHTDFAARGRLLMTEGKPVEAVDYFEARRAEIADDAAAQLELGHAYASLRRYADALAAYERAWTEDDDVGADRALRANLLLMLDLEDGDIAAGAGRRRGGGREDGAGRAHLVELASHHPDNTHRARMRELAEQLGLGARIDRVATYELDLLHAETCEQREAAVAKLRALGKGDAIAALDQARQREGNDCLTAAADDAIRYLEALAPPPPEPKE